MKRTNTLLVIALSSAITSLITERRVEANEGFSANELSAVPEILGTQTRGWGFTRSDFLGANQQILITHIGVFDYNGDGLVNSHQVGLWHLTSSTPDGGTLLASTTVPAGTDAPLLNGYRYSSISPIVLPPQAYFVIGASYAAGDPDDLIRPVNGEFAMEIRHPSSTGLVSLGPDLSMPFAGIGRGMEGEPNYDFFPVNFQFEVVPEPSTAAMLLAGGLLLVLLRRRSC